jgi:Bacteriophage head to tail connecting protein
MTDWTPTGIMRRAGALASDRSNFEDLWQQIAERMLPGSANFSVKRMPGEKQTDKMLDATAALAVRKYSTILESMMTPRHQKWHRLVAAEEALAESHEVKEYLDEVNTLLFKYRYAPQSNFAGQIGCAYLELGAFGTTSLFLDETWDNAVQRSQQRYKAMPLAETYFAENHVGLIDTVYRKFEYTAAQALAKWPDSVPSEIRVAAGKNPDQRFCFYHCVAPSEGLTGDKLLRDHRFASIYVSETGQQEVQRGGYYTFPSLIMRDLTSAGEIYGRSPGTWVLPDVKMLNDMNRTVIRAAQKVVDPPLMMTEDGALSGFNLRPGASNPGTLGPNGEELVKPFNSGARIDIGLEMMQAKQQTINEAFFITLFQILVDNPTMTATEVLERAQEKGMLLGPLAGRQQSEFLGPMVERELELLYRAGRLPEPPPELMEAGGEYKIEYESPLARAQRAEEGVAIVRTLETLVPLAELRPEVLDNFDLDETVRALGEINGMAASLMRDPDDVDEMREERQQAQQLQQAAELAPGLAKGVKDLTQAEAEAA